MAVVTENINWSLSLSACLYGTSRDVAVAGQKLYLAIG